MTKFSKLALFVFCSLASQMAMSAIVTHSCRPTEVRELYLGGNQSRAHVVCATAYTLGADKIGIFALPIDPSMAPDAAGAASALVNMSTAALTSGRTIQVMFDTADTSGAAYGCAAVNCRKPFHVFIK